MTAQKLVNATNHGNFSPESGWFDADQHTTAGSPSQTGGRLPLPEMER